MTIRFDGVPQKYRCLVRGKTPYAAGYSWGRQSREHMQRIIGNVSVDTKNSEYVARSLAYMKSGAASGLCTYRGVRYLAQYMETFHGFCSGAGIDELTCAALQMEYSVGCQTVFAKNESGTVNFFHMEENVDDSNVTRMHWNAQSGYKPSSIGSNQHIPTYDYRIVDWKIPGENLYFFSYPGLVAGGPSMGINKTTGSIIVVDTINPLSDPGLFWHNALASMILSAGTIDALRYFSSELTTRVARHNGFSGGYAIHMLESSGAMMSLECGGSFVQTIDPSRDGEKRFIAQTNYPRSKSLRTLDKYSKKQSENQGATVKSVHLAMSARARTRRLVRLAKTLYSKGRKSMENILSIEHSLHAFRGDWEQAPDSYVSNGVFSIYVVGYLTGTRDRGNCTVVFHAPVQSGKSTDHCQWWPLGKKLPWGRDLYKDAKKRLVGKEDSL